MNNKNVHKKVLTRSDASYVANLINEYAEEIKNVIYSTVSNRNDLIEEAVSDLHLLMCEKIEDIKTHSCPKAWILVSAKRVAQGVIAKARRYSSVVPLDDIVEIADERSIEDEAIFQIWMDEKVPEKLIGRLSKREREVYDKIYVEGKTTKETASDLNISLNAVHNIHKNLRDKIKDDVKRKNF